MDGEANQSLDLLGGRSNDELPGMFPRPLILFTDANVAVAVANLGVSQSALTFKIVAARRKQDSGDWMNSVRLHSAASRGGLRLEVHLPQENLTIQPTELVTSMGNYTMIVAGSQMQTLVLTHSLLLKPVPATDIEFRIEWLNRQIRGQRVLGRGDLKRAAEDAVRLWQGIRI